MNRAKFKQNQFKLIDWLETQDISPAESVTLLLSIAGFMLGVLVRHNPDPATARAEGVRLATNVLNETSGLALPAKKDSSGAPTPVSAPPKTFTI
jgi:hypothetical protein